MPLQAIISRIRALTILGAVVGAQYAGVEGAIIGAIIGYFLDLRFGI